MRELSQCSALLFDGSSANAVSRLFVGASQAWMVHADDGVAAFQQALHDIDTATRAGAHVVLSMSYEALQSCSVGAGMPWQDKPSAHPDIEPTPLLQALVFDAPRRLSRAEALDWLKQQGATASTLLTPTVPLVSEREFADDIDSIRALIAAGDSYQVNYTFPVLCDLLATHDADAAHHDDALAKIYHQLVQDLRIPYGAYLTLPANSLLSFSPELFVELNHHTLTCRPMKGTMAVAETDNETTRRAAMLAADPKNRAENLMIVDLMRNDLSALSCTRHVRVPTLFEVKRYGAVLQMTSTVCADLHAQPSLSELFNAVFPCGSITGAPKRRTIEIIDALEPYARGAYCGAIGHIEPAADGKINATFSVPIRTLETSATPIIQHAATPSRHAIARWPIQLSVGAGITHDSNAADEWQESLLKARFLTQHTQTFELIETMRVTQNDDALWQVTLLDEHRGRMANSARALGLPFDATEFNDAVHSATTRIVTHPSETPPDAIRLRLALSHDGFSHVLAVAEPTPDCALFSIHPTHTDSRNPFLQHKTSVRVQYNDALCDAITRGLFDYVFVNERGDITEGARSNIFICLHGEWLTPPLHCGVLAGVQRGQLIQKLKAQEKILSVEDVRGAEKILLCNALHGAIIARLV
ncbi:MAG: chorismate-binding protein [Formosimonas sp.]